jgi:hypothetical protein
VATDPAKIPPQYATWWAGSRFERALDELERLSVAHGFEVVVVTHLEYDLVVPMLEAAAARGFHVVSTHEEAVPVARHVYHEPLHAPALHQQRARRQLRETASLRSAAQAHRRRLVYELWEQGLVPRLLEKVPKAP